MVFRRSHDFTCNSSQIPQNSFSTSRSAIYPQPTKAPETGPIAPLRYIPPGLHISPELTPEEASISKQYSDSGQVSTRMNDRSTQELARSSSFKHDFTRIPVRHINAPATDWLNQVALLMPIQRSAMEMEQPSPGRLTYGTVIQEMGDSEIYVYSPQENRSFGLPEGVELNPGEVIEFKVHEDKIVEGSIKPIVASPLTLSRMEVEPIKVGQFGEFQWKCFWQLNTPSRVGGYVVQDITWMCAYTPPGEEPVPPELHQYQEAWQVESGARFTQNYIKDTLDWLEEARQLQQQSDAEEDVEITETPYDDELAQDEPVAEGSKGFIIITAKARFYEGLNLPATFIENNPETLADALPSRKDINRADLNTASMTNEATVTIRVDWDAMGKTKVTIK